VLVCAASIERTLVRSLCCITARRYSDTLQHAEACVNSNSCVLGCMRAFTAAAKPSVQLKPCCYLRYCLANCCHDATRSSTVANLHKIWFSENQYERPLKLIMMSLYKLSGREELLHTLHARTADNPRLPGRITNPTVCVTVASPKKKEKKWSSRAAALSNKTRATHRKYAQPQYLCNVYIGPNQSK
jgi:hypothetical protein